MEGERMLVRAICQIEQANGYTLVIWNRATKCWESEPEIWEKPHPRVPMIEKGWIFQYLHDDEWRTHGTIFPINKVPTDGLFEDCA